MKSKIIVALACLGLMLAIGTGCMTFFPLASTPDEKLYINGHIYTGNPSVPWAQALAVRDGVFTYVGTTEGALARRWALDRKGTDTKIVDLGGKTLIPGLYDSHIHPISAGEGLLYKCKFPQSASLDEILAAVKTFAATAEPGAWITGGRWSPALLNRLDRRQLDKVSMGHPVVLHDFSNHNVWANTRAMEAAGITQETAKAYGKLVQRNARGEMTGVLIEKAVELVANKIPARTQAEMDKSLLRALRELHQYGIIGIKDSYAGRAELLAYNRLDVQNALTAHVAGVLSWDKGPANETLTQRKRRILGIRTLTSPHVKTDFAKISLDGIPPTKTAAMIDPYIPTAEGNIGSLTMTKEDFMRDVAWLDAQGFSVKVHAVGDRAARICLDAFEAAQKANGPGRRHEVAHACIIAPEDMARFASLDVIPDLSPVFWYPGPLFDGLVGLIGEERTRNFCPVADFMKTGAFPTHGTDWPVAETVNPWVAIEAFVTRENPHGLEPGRAAAPAQKISLEQALTLATINGARAQGIEETSGSIEVGKTADFLVLDQDIFSVAPHLISDTKVLTTYFEGRLVYQGQ